MNIFNKIIPWFIPTKDDQRKWYKEELFENPKEVDRLIMEFSDLSREYNEKLGMFEAGLSRDFQLYELYLEVKNLAQKTNFIWNRIEYKNTRSFELQKRLAEMDKF
jgi:hypothetical protein